MKLKTRSAPQGHEATASRDAGMDAAGLRPSPLVLIDDVLRQFVSRHLVTGSEVVDALLDLRSAIENDLRFAVLVDPNER